MSVDLIEDFKKLQDEIEKIEYDCNLKDYHAFIYWFINTMFSCSKKDILDSICDGTHDKGIDSVLIDSREQRVIIIQSKYEHAGGQSQINEKDVMLFSNVPDFFKSKSALNAAVTKGNSTTQKLMNEAFDVIRKKKYTLELNFITTHKIAPHVNDLIYKTRGFTEDKFKLYYFEKIMQLYYDELKDFTPKLPPYNLPFIDTDKAIIKVNPHKSWVISVSADDIRTFVNTFQDKLFRKNVRNFLGTKSRTNKGIIETLEADSDNFWYFNNGITILCDSGNIKMEEKYIRMENPQIVNGCQTVKSIQKYNKDLKSELMVRVIEGVDHDFVNYLTLYQNSSNQVKNRDLKSNDPIQIRLKREFFRQGYYYEIKTGEEYDKMIKFYPSIKNDIKKDIINNNDIAKYLAIIKIGPATALQSGSDKFFSDDYDQIFNNNISTFNCITPYLLYELIKKTYQGKTKKFYAFEKDWVFKNRALYYIISFIYDSFKKYDNWEKHFVSYYEELNDDEKKKLINKLEKPVSSYFNYIYKTWEKEEYYNTYLQNQKTLSKILKKYKSQINKLNKNMEEIFSKALTLVV